MDEAVSSLDIRLATRTACVLLDVTTHTCFLTAVPQSFGGKLPRQILFTFLSTNIPSFFGQSVDFASIAPSLHNSWTEQFDTVPSDNYSILQIYVYREK